MGARLDGAVSTVRRMGRPVSVPGNVEESMSAADDDVTQRLDAAHKRLNQEAAVFTPLIFVGGIAAGWFGGPWLAALLIALAIGAWVWHTKRAFEKAVAADD
jgi:hypothetical protein